MVVEATVRISAQSAGDPHHAGQRSTAVPDAGACVAAIIADGIVPAAMEFMDRRHHRRGGSL